MFISYINSLDVHTLEPNWSQVILLPNVELKEVQEPMKNEEHIKYYFVILWGFSFFFFSFCKSKK